MTTAPLSESEIQERMSEQLRGFRTLTRFRAFGYKAAIVASIIVGISSITALGAKEAFTKTFLWLIFGLAGVRLLTTPIALYLWFRHWRCPRCQKRLGIRTQMECPHCKVKLFSDTKE